MQQVRLSAHCRTHRVVTTKANPLARATDNAVMERFFGTLKRECTSRERFKTHEEARTAIFEYIEAFYNRVRKHSMLGYLSPVHFELLHS
jgi:transposase InsO family protein